MKLSARNQIAGTIKTVTPGATTTHVTIEVSPTVVITASDSNYLSCAGSELVRSVRRPVLPAPGDRG
jgi:hypothetical protein